MDENHEKLPVAQQLVPNTPIVGIAEAGLSALTA